MGVTAGLRLLARQPAWRAWTLSAFLARLPITMTLLALVLLGERAADSLAVGAQLSGIAMIGSGLAAVWRGRLLDRGELTTGLRRDCLLTASALLGLVAAAHFVPTVPVLYGLAALLGVAMAPLSGGFRALLPAIVAPADLPRANAVEAVMIEVGFVTGPALAGMLAIVVGPVGVLVTMAGSALIAAVIVSRLPRLHPPAQRPPLAPWRVPGVRPVLGLALLMGATIGMFESLVPARVVALGSDAELAGPLLALVAVGSVLGGLVASARADAVADVRRLAAWLLLAFGVLVAPAAGAPSLWWLAPVLLLAGAPIAPLNALGSFRLHGAVPMGRQGEGFSVYIAAVTLGIGGGQTLVGQTLGVLGPERLLVVCALIPVLAAVLVSLPWTRRRPARAAGRVPAEPGR